MTLAQIRNEFHRVIDEINDPEKLERYLNIISAAEADNSISLLSDEEFKEVMESFEQSENPANLVSWEEFKKDLDKWRLK